MQVHHGCDLRLLHKWRRPHDGLPLHDHQERETFLACDWVLHSRVLLQRVVDDLVDEILLACSLPLGACLGSSFASGPIGHVTFLL